jgi:hypothetical protein
MQLPHYVEHTARSFFHIVHIRKEGSPYLLVLNNKFEESDYER